MNDKKLIYISIDSGKSHTKVAWYENNDLTAKMMTDVFRSVVNPIVLNDFFNTERIIKYENTFYDVGGDEVRLSYENSKLTMIHELCIYAGIAMALIDLKVGLQEVQPVKVAINVPLHDFKMNREKYIQKYLNKCVELTLNHKKVQFIIKEIELFYEGSGAIIKNTTTGDGDYYVIDIGGRNDTHILFSNFRPVKNRNTMTNNGILPLLQSVASELSVGGYDYEIIDVESILAGVKPKTRYFDDVFFKYAKSHVGRIRNQLQTFKIIPDHVTLIISGGGSIILRSIMEDEFGSEFKMIFAESGQFDNVTGGLMMLSKDK